MQSNPLSAMSASAAGTQTTTRNVGGTLGKDDFLKVLVGQMQHMDPMSQSNQDPTQSISQMAQFSIVEQLTNLQQATAKQGAMAMLGKTVTYKSGDGAHTGVVESVDTSKSEPTLTIGGTGGITASTVTEVR